MRYFIGLVLTRNGAGSIYQALWNGQNPQSLPYGNPAAPAFEIGSDPWSDGTLIGSVEPKNSTTATAVAIIKNSNSAGVWAAVTATVAGGYVCEINDAQYCELSRDFWLNLNILNFSLLLP